MLEMEMLLGGLGVAAVTAGGLGVAVLTTTMRKILKKLELIETEVAKIAQIETEVATLRTDVATLKTTVSNLDRRLSSALEPGVIDALKQRTVAIFYTKPKGKIQMCIGTGFLFQNSGQHFVLTAAHTLYEEKAFALGSFFLRRCAGKKRFPITASNCFAFRGLDVAVIKILSTEPDRVLSPAHGVRQPDMKPDFVVAAFQMWNNKSHRNPQMRAVPVLSWSDESTSHVNYFSQTFKGDSGAAVVERNGDVLALHCGTLNEVDSHKKSSRSPPRKSKSRGAKIKANQKIQQAAKVRRLAWTGLDD